MIDINNWKELSITEQVATIFHEMSHDVFNFKHVEWDELSLMHPFSQPTSLEELNLMTIRMLENYKAGMIETFKPNEIYIHGNSKKSKVKVFNRLTAF